MNSNPNLLNFQKPPGTVLSISSVLSYSILIVGVIRPILQKRKLSNADGDKVELGIPPRGI